VLYRVAGELGATKIALATTRRHPRDFFPQFVPPGQAQGDARKAALGRRRHIVIRPLAYVPNRTFRPTPPEALSHHPL